MSNIPYKKLFCQIRNALQKQDTATAATVLAAISKAKYPEFFQQLQRAFHPDLQTTQRKKKNPIPKTVEERECRCHARTFMKGTGDGCCTFASKDWVTLPGKQGTIGLCSLHAKLFNTCNREGIPEKSHDFYFWKHGQPKPESTIHTWKGKETTYITVNLLKLEVGKINYVPYAYGMTHLNVTKHSDQYEISLSFPKTKKGQCERTYTYPKPTKENPTVTLTFPVPTGLKWGLKYDANHKEAPKVIYIGKCGQNGYSEEKFLKSCQENIGAVTPPEPIAVDPVDSDSEDSDSEDEPDNQAEETDEDSDEDSDEEPDESTISNHPIDNISVPITTDTENSSLSPDSQQTIEDDSDESDDEDSLRYVPNTDSEEESESDSDSDSDSD